MSEQPCVLCVDDDPAMLEFLGRTLRADYDVTTEDRPLAALQLLESGEREFAAIVSDMQMPLMDGAKFLSLAAKAAPRATRVMLTGQRELAAAVAAVNTGQVFRFLSKPCVPHELVATVRAAVEQHRLSTLEQRLLANTLAGSVRLMSEVLGLVAPGLFAHTSSVQRYVQYLAQKLGRTDGWRFELAACLHMIGCVGLPDETLRRALAGEALSEDEARAFAEHPKSAHRLLQKIPHFEDVAEMIQLESTGLRAEGDGQPADIELGATMLRVARVVAQRTALGASESEAVTALSASAQPQELELLELLRGFGSVGHLGALKELSVAELTAQMVLEDDVKTKTGVMILGRGKPLTDVLIERLLRFSRAGVLVEPVRVRVPS